MSLFEKATQSPAVQAALRQWNQLSGRDRLALKVLVSFFSLFLAYSLVVQPVLDYENAQIRYYESRLAFLKEVKAAEPELKAASSKGPATKAASTSLINRLARKHKIAIKQISPDRDKQVRTTFENVEAKSMLALVQELSQQHGVKVIQGSIDRRAPGRVNAKLVFGT